MLKLTAFLFFIFYSSELLPQCTGQSRVISVPDPVNQSTFNIEMKVWRPFSPAGKFPVIFILPPIVGETPLDASLAAYFCLNNMAAYVLNVSNDPSEEEQILNLNVHEDALIRAEHALDILLDELEQDPAVSGKFGILGASLGGILSAYLSGNEPRIKATVLIAAGGDIPDILARSQQNAVRRLREKRIEKFSLKGPREYKILLEPFVTRGPLVFAPFIENALLYVLTLDLDVPTKNQRDLARAIPGARVRELTNIHVPGIIAASTVYAQEIKDFFINLLR
jgi:hypothetical protein